MFEVAVCACILESRHKECYGVVTWLSSEVTL